MTDRPPATPPGRSNRTRVAILILVAVAVLVIAVDLVIVSKPRHATPIATSTNEAKPARTTALLPLVALSEPNGPVRLGQGEFTVDDFDSTLTGAMLPPGGVIGAGTSRTEIAMSPNTSTHATDVATAPGTTNQLYLLRLSGGSPVLRDFSLVGTPQHHLYNGMLLYRTTDAHVTNVSVRSVPGDADVPPGETFGINDAHGVGDTFDHVSVDGAGIGASGFATNSSASVTVTDSTFTHSGSAHGATFWQTSGVTIDHVVSSDNRDCGFNFERVSGSVTITDATMHGDVLCDIRIGSDQGDATYRIVDPVYSGTKLRILLPTVYRNTANLQQRADIHVFAHGVDVTASVVRWITADPR